MKSLKRAICRLIGHRGIRTITAADLLSMHDLGYVVNGHRWDCSRCGSTGVKMRGFSR